MAEYVRVLVHGLDLTKGKIYLVIRDYHGGYRLRVKDDAGDGHDLWQAEFEPVDLDTVRREAPELISDERHIIEYQEIKYNLTQDQKEDHIICEPENASLINDNLPQDYTPPVEQPVFRSNLYNDKQRQDAEEIWRKHKRWFGGE